MAAKLHGSTDSQNLDVQWEKWQQRSQWLWNVSTTRQDKPSEAEPSLKETNRNHEPQASGSAYAGSRSEIQDNATHAFHREITTCSDWASEASTSFRGRKPSRRREPAFETTNPASRSEVWKFVRQAPQNGAAFRRGAWSRGFSRKCLARHRPSHSSGAFVYRCLQPFVFGAFLSHSAHRRETAEAGTVLHTQNRQLLSSGMLGQENTMPEDLREQQKPRIPNSLSLKRQSSASA